MWMHYYILMGITILIIDTLYAIELYINLIKNNINSIWYMIGFVIGKISLIYLWPIYLIIACIYNDQ